MGERAPARRRGYPPGLVPELLLATAIGLAGGLLTLLYWALMTAVTRLLWERPVSPFLIMLPAALLLGLLPRYLGEPGNVEEMLREFHREGRISWRRTPSMFLTSLISIVAGGSAGPEAPIAQITGSSGSWIQARWMPRADLGLRRRAVLAGLAAGFTALFGAPVGGALFALELPHDWGLEYWDAIPGVLVASMTSYLAYAIVGNSDLAPAWHFFPYRLHHPDQLLYALLTGAAGAVVVYLLTGVYRLLRRLVLRFPVPLPVRTLLGGILLATAATLMPLSLFYGGAQIPLLINHPYSWQFLLLLLVVKIVTLSVSLISGWRGGFIIPSFFLGAILGRALSLLLPGLNPSFAMLTAMAATNAGLLRTPMATVIILTSMSGVDSIPPLLLATLTSLLLTAPLRVVETKESARWPR